MHTGIVAMVAMATVCAMARSSGRAAIPALEKLKDHRGELPVIPDKDYFGKYVVPKYMFPYHLGYEESPDKSRSLANNPRQDWFSKEIERINQLALGEDMGPYEPHFPQNVQEDPFFKRLYINPKKEKELREFDQDYNDDKAESFIQTIQQKTLNTEPNENSTPRVETLVKINSEETDEEKKKFALSPSDKEYYRSAIADQLIRSADNTDDTIAKDDANENEQVNSMNSGIQVPRQTRQNPNLNKEKTLVAANLGKIQSGMTNKDFRLTVSLVPTNLRWLNLERPDKNEESSNEETKVTPRPDGVHVLENPTADPANSIYSVALIAAVGAALAMAIFGFAIGWYTLSKKAKAAADVDYPAYGVTGPSIDMSGDRKLAHSAHMYHYQHQKQQILAMERNGLEHRNGSVSDPESEEENEEGDYTVYECPGFATTGNMEVKNPLFSEDPSPLTPGKCQVVKQQPKD